ncbi:hypothetical protein RhiirA4_442693 [Rhizophagus irregularis]|uniref:Uncharacterized protein n=1 Tax=Rhizophagus irregularis TaxID=588596 RepID=A0A2I1GAL0_9GLOM|nr:hypothetical protein RhiirA4_442693 [Rhizophagus irregularis]
MFILNYSEVPYSDKIIKDEQILPNIEKNEVSHIFVIEVVIPNVNKKVFYNFEDFNNQKRSFLKETSGSIPSKRYGLSVVLGLDGKKVIIFGGKGEWSIPIIFGKIPKSRIFHKAHVIGKYMVISFGKYNTYSIIQTWIDYCVNAKILMLIGMGYDKSVESDILLLDISHDIK